jgi:hypothetical protein
MVALHALGWFAAIVGGWLAVTTLLGALSGWFLLESRYPLIREDQACRLSMESGWFGMIQYRGCLNLSAGASGLRVGVWSLFGPLEKPFTVPWAEIWAVRVPGMFGATAQLGFGDTGVAMRIGAATWEDLVAVAQGRSAYN